MEVPLRTGYVYRIVNDIDDEIYVGSTSQSLQNRFAGHVFAMTEGATHRLAEKMRNMGVANFHIELLQNVHYSNVTELRHAENEAIKTLAPTLNHRSALGRNMEVRVAYLKARHLQQYAEKREEIIARVHRYAEANKEKIAERTKEYRAKNAESINEKKKERMTCEFCGCIFTKCHRSRHQASKKCLATRAPTCPELNST
jgi:proline racemase